MGTGSLCSPDTVVAGLLFLADMIWTENKGKILLIGTCWYELTGLLNLLLVQGHDVYRVPLGYSCVREGGT